MQTQYLRARQSGLTMIEMMVTVAVLAIIISIATPSFRQLLDNSRVASQTDQLVTAFNTARSEAIRNGRGAWFTARAGDFSNGWCVRTDNQDCGTDDADLLDFSSVDPRLEITQGTPATLSFALNRLGALQDPGTATVLVVKPKVCGDGLMMRRININATGRIAIDRVNC